MSTKDRNRYKLGTYNNREGVDFVDAFYSHRPAGM